MRGRAQPTRAMDLSANAGLRGAAPTRDNRCIQCVARASDAVCPTALRAIPGGA